MSEGRTPPALEGLVPVPTYRGHPSPSAADLEGVDLHGSPTRIRVVGTGRWTLLLFLSGSCRGCREIWRALGDLRHAGLSTDELVVAVTRDLDDEDPEELLGLSTPSVPTLASSAAWRAYGVQGPPFFSLVDGTSNVVVTEGVAWGVGQVGDHVQRARRGSGGPTSPG